jgi:hypothetical protein
VEDAVNQRVEKLPTRRHFNETTSIKIQIAQNLLIESFYSGSERAAAEKHGHDQAGIVEGHGPDEGSARAQQPRGNFRVN